MQKSFLFGLVLITALAACTSTRPYVAPEHRTWTQRDLPATNVAYRVFLIGDAGDLTTGAPVLRLLRLHLADAGANSAVVFLGDNAYGHGLPDSTALARPIVEARLRAQIDAVRDHPGRVVFLPGNHDWASQGPDGLVALNRQERFVEAAFDSANVFLPDDGFPGPIEIELTDNMILVVLDTQWWLHPYDKPYGDADDYEIEEDGDVLLEVEDIVLRRDDETLVVVGHHPLYSNGRHNGFVPARDHVFPLTNRIDNAYVPLPGLGSLYPLYVRAFGGRQDLAHRRYRRLRHGLAEIFAQHDKLIYAAGHEHNLQYFEKDDRHFLVSGAGSRPEPVARGHGAVFAAGGMTGFMVLHAYDDGAVWLEAWTPTADGDGRRIFRAELYGPDPERTDKDLPATDGHTFPDYTDSTAVIVPDPTYAAGPVKRFFWGDLHRDAWTTPVEVSYLDVGTEHDGLTPIKRGGGLQTTSLRLLGGDGKQYVLRSVRKDPARSLPPALRRTVAASISRDQAASQHPFGALLVPPLADAVGVYHTNPRFVYVPKDPRLGVYADVIGDQLALFEERPDGDMSDAPHFGNARDVIGTPKMVREVTDDNDHHVDQRMLARARLLDLLMSDWDRHPDQWRWAAFEPYELDPALDGEARTQGKIYRPIPRDRDVAFNRLNGLFPGLAKPFTKYQDFTEDYGNLRGLTLNAWSQDHRFLSELERADWIAIAEDMQARLTDAALEDAVRRWPDVFFEQQGESFIDRLKRRRDKLPVIAEAFYELHAKSVDVVGSNKHERFEVTRLDDDRTRVLVYKTSKEGEKRTAIYERTFFNNETKELLLYGFDGEDTFVVEGEVDDGIMIAAIGGPGRDTFIDRSRVRGVRRLTRFYDTDADNTWTPGPETAIIRSDDPAVNRYAHTVRYDTLAPAPMLASDRDNGLTLGTSVRLVRHRLRKQPYAHRHVLTASYALGARALAMHYEGHFVGNVGGWDRRLDATWRGPNTIRNFFGLGNETDNPDDERDERFNQTRLWQLTVAPALAKTLGNGLRVRAGPRFEVTEVKQDTGRFIGQPEASVPARTFDAQWYAGGEASLALTFVDHPANPRQGLRWNGRALFNAGVENTDDAFVTLGSELIVYASPSLYPQVTLAARAGAAHTVGDFPYYHANTLGGVENLRGYRNERFAGRSSFFQNVEVRLGLLDFTTYLALGEAGVLGFFDHGRVWADGLSSEAWHRGYGGGVWLNLFDRFVLTGTYGVSEDEDSFTMRMGFLY